MVQTGKKGWMVFSRETTYPLGSNIFNKKLHCKKSARFSRPQPGCLARECLVSDIPAGDGKIGNLFFTVYGPDRPDTEIENIFDSDCSNFLFLTIFVCVGFQIFAESSNIKR